MGRLRAALSFARLSFARLGGARIACECLQHHQPPAADAWPVFNSNVSMLEATMRIFCLWGSWGSPVAVTMNQFKGERGGQLYYRPWKPRRLGDRDRISGLGPDLSKLRLS